MHHLYKCSTQKSSAITAVTQIATLVLRD